MMGWYDHGWGLGAWIGMGLGMVVFWGLVVLGIIALIRWTGSERRDVRRSDGRRPVEAQSALQILDERFARGDLSAEEYQQRRAVLTRK